MHGERLSIPNYLLRTYWWAYVHPRAIRLFERQWLVNLILWGNFARLRDLALEALGGRLDGRTLQIACVYGDLTARLARRIPAGAGLDVVDVLPLQLQNLSRKLSSADAATLICGDSAALRAADESYDRALLFFLLHEQPAEVRRRTLAEAIRVVKPGGRIVVVDYHRPHALHPLRLPMRGVLGALEPYALDLWRHELSHWLPPECALGAVAKRTFFGGLYQVVTITRREIMAESA
jgi:ubiquinone/menaquinone biosynthesis C-methylase UbiE